MALSGSNDFNMTARQLGRFAMLKLGILDAEQSPSASEFADIKTELNMMLKAWQMHGPNLWRQTFGNVTLVADTASYTLSPQPHRVIEARYRDASGRDLPMWEMTRQEYVELPLKTSSGIPTTYYVDYQRAVTTFYIWPVPSSITMETIQYTYQAKMDDIDALDDDIDIPQEWFECIGYNLADRLQPTFGTNVPQVKEMAAQFRFEAEADDREDYVRFVVDSRR